MTFFEFYKVSVYPLPVQDQLIIEWVNADNARIEWFDAKGQLLTVLDSVRSGEVLDISFFDDGSYQIEIIINGARMKKKIKKENSFSFE